MWNPDIDDVVLDDEYYELMGRDAGTRQPGEDYDDVDSVLEVDPESQILTVEDIEGMLQDTDFQRLFSSGDQQQQEQQQGAGQADEPVVKQMPKVDAQASCKRERPHRRLIFPLFFASIDKLPSLCHYFPIAGLCCLLFADRLLIGTASLALDLRCHISAACYEQRGYLA